MQNSDKQFRKLEENASRLEHRYEKALLNPDISNSQRLFSSLVFVIITTLLCTSLFLILHNTTNTSLKDAFIIEGLSSVLLCAFLFSGMMFLYFMSKKLLGAVILVLAIVEIAAVFILFADFSIILNNKLFFSSCAIITVFCAVFTTRALTVKIKR